MTIPETFIVQDDRGANFRGVDQGARFINITGWAFGRYKDPNPFAHGEQLLDLVITQFKRQNKKWGVLRANPTEYPLMQVWIVEGIPDNSKG